MAVFMDIVVAVLLVTTIGYAVVLNKRLSALRGDRAELDGLAAKFGDATKRAEESVLRLKVASEDAIVSLQEGIRDARALREDLAFLTERGDAVADALEVSVRSARGVSGPTKRIKGAGESGSPESGGTEEETGRSDAERELLKALQAIR